MKNNYLSSISLKHVTTCLLVILSLNSTYGQRRKEAFDSIDIVFYNVENLFDTKNDPENDDDEFTPSGARKWTPSKYFKKINLIGQAIISFTNFKFPGIVAFAEIENRSVLDDLIHQSILRNGPYKILHSNSADQRGIDVGLIYDSTIIYPVHVEFIPVNLSQGDHTRDILYLKAMVAVEHLHVFVNHWPSRFSGARNSDSKRMEAAKILIQKCDSILCKDKNAKIIIMGDFNDEPEDASIRLITDYKIADSDKIKFCNLMKTLSGTIKYQGLWFVFDQFIVSRSLLEAENGLYAEPEIEIADQDFLFMPDQKYLDKQPFRTYNGYRYLGGYSDHLPIKATIKLTK